jgi:hypothetical protein
MKTLATLGLGMWLTMTAAASSPPPWFHSALVNFLDNPRVLVVGWSKDGAAAVMSPVDGEGRGGTGVDLWVIDTVEDQVLKVVDLWSDEFDGLPDTSEALAAAMESSMKGRLFLASLKDAAVQPSSPPLMELQDFPLKTDQTQYSAETVTRPVGGEAEGLAGRTLEWRLEVRSAQGEKTIAKGREDNAIDVLVKGYIASPWEPRILVVYGITHPGFEGEQPLSYQFSGCLLTRGFAAK